MAPGTAEQPALADCREVSANGGRVTGLNQWCGAEVDIGCARKDADCRHQGRTNQPDGDNF